jgi:hypothetical protein
MSYLFEFDKDYHSSSDSDYNPNTDSAHSTDCEYESENECENELECTPVKERPIDNPIQMPVIPVKKRPINMPLKNVRPVKMTFSEEMVQELHPVHPMKQVRPVRERNQPIRYQA